MAVVVPYWYSVGGEGGREGGREGGEGRGGEGRGGEGKGREGKGREGKGREGKGREGKGKGGDRGGLGSHVLNIGPPLSKLLHQPLYTASDWN